MSTTARATVDEAISRGVAIVLSTISIVKIVYLTEKGRLVPMTLSRLTEYLDLPDGGFTTQDLTPGIARNVGQISRSAVPDMPDRIIAATALHLNLPLVTKDRKIRTVESIVTIW